MAKAFLLLCTFLLPFALCAAEPGVFAFHHEGVLGTSLDLQFAAADAQQAAATESAVLAEIERMRKILSTYDPASEISRLNAATGTVPCSQELLDVLSGYDWWNAKSGGAYNGHLGDLIRLWRAAEQAGAMPDAAALQRTVAALRVPAWKLDAAARTVTRTTAQPLNVDSLGKGYIISRAAAVARAKAPQGFLINVGGDIFAGGRSWKVGVANPKSSADNSPPLTEVTLKDFAISTSAAYDRGYTIAGKRYSHIFDPRTGQPAAATASATVIASNNAVANALATTLCVLRPDEGLAFAKTIPGVECLIVAPDGRQLRTANFAKLEDRPPSAAITPQTPQSGAWPKGFQVTLALTLKTPPPGGGGKRGPKRPYVAVWIEDADGKRVRTVAVWGNQRKYMPDLREWWKVAREDEQWAASITRATRSAGSHRVAWDGLDDKGGPLPPGTYTVVLEVNREHGTYCIERGAIACAKTAAQGKIPVSAEFAEAQITFGPPAP
jgi:thiamine biosynthesis lipoprotein ApbE